MTCTVQRSNGCQWWWCILTIIKVRGVHSIWILVSLPAVPIIAIWYIPVCTCSIFPQCTIHNRNVHISVLNDALWDMEQVHYGICELSQLAHISHEFCIRFCRVLLCLVGLSSSGPWFNKKMSSYQYRKSHCGDKTILQPSYLHNGIPYTGKTTSLYWFGALILVVLHYSTVTWASWGTGNVALFFNGLFRLFKKKTGPLWRESTGDQWIRFTKGW